MKRFSHKNFIYAVIISLAVHISLILLIPEIRIAPLRPKLRVIPIKMVQVIPPKPKKKVRKKRKKLVSKKKVRKKKKSVKKKKPRKKIPKKKKKPINYSVSQITAKLGKRKVQISLSSLKIPEITPQTLPLPDDALTANEPDLFEEENLVDAFTEKDFSPIRFEQAKRIPVAKLKKPIKSDSRISWGKGVAREFVYRPDPPEYYSRIEGEVKIKFWVDPGGNVTQALPLRRLDAHLEQISIDFIKRWRFTSLEVGVEEDQWGVLTLKFLHN